MPLKLANAPRTGSNSAVGRVLGGMLEKMGYAPLGGLLRFRPVEPSAEVL